MPRVLSDVEKHAVIGMHLQNVPISKIKNTLELSKSSRVVENFIKEYKSQQPQVSNVVYEVYAKLGEAGIARDMAKVLVDRVLKTMKEAGADSKKLTTQQLYNASIGAMGPREFIRTKTDGGEPGVAVMTPEASSAKPKRPPIEDSSSKNPQTIFNPKTGKFEN